MKLTLEKEDVLPVCPAERVSLLFSALDQPECVRLLTYGHGKLVILQIEVKILVVGLIMRVKVFALDNLVVEVDGRGVRLVVVHPWDSSHRLFYTPKMRRSWMRKLYSPPCVVYTMYCTIACMAICT